MEPNGTDWGLALGIIAAILLVVGFGWAWFERRRAKKAAERRKAAEKHYTERNEMLETPPDDAERATRLVLEEAVARAERAAKAAEARLRAGATTPSAPSSQPGPSAPPSNPGASLSDPDSWTRWDEYPPPPWPGEVLPQQWDVDPETIRAYASPPIALADGEMFIRLYVYAGKRDGTPAAMTPLIFADPTRIPILSGETGYPYLPADVYPWNNPTAGEPGESPVAVVIESDHDEDYAPYLPNGTWLDEFGEWEGYLRLAEPVDRREAVTLVPRVGGRVPTRQTRAASVMFEDAAFFEANPSYLQYLPDRITEARFEQLARQKHDPRGRPVDTPKKTKPTKP